MSSAAADPPTPPAPQRPYDAVVLAGGESSRLGGIDKMLVEVDGVRLIDRALDAVAGARQRVAVGPPRSDTPDAVWVREAPPRGGPVAALAAGLAAVRADVVVLLAADLPFVSARHVTALVDACGDDVDGVLFVDAGGRDQPLLSAWRATRLRAVLPFEPAGHGLRRILAPLTVRRLQGGDDLLDCDTPAGLERARQLAAEPAANQGPEKEDHPLMSTLDDWVSDVLRTLELDPTGYDRDLLLDLTRDVAHRVARPAAPLTAYLAGLAAGGAGGDRKALEDAVARITELLPAAEPEPAKEQ